MADEPVVEPQIDAELPEELLQPGDEGSLADLLDQERQQMIAKHAGAPDPEEVPEVPEAPEQPEAPAGVQPEEKSAEEAPPAPPEKKYKTWEEAEEGAREHQRFATEKAEEAKRAREELADLRQKLADKAEPDKPAEPDKTVEALEAEEEERIAKALDEIENLDADDPAYKRNVAKAWRKAKLGGSEALGGKALDEMIDRRLEERLSAKEAEGTRQRQEAEETRTRSTAAELAIKAGLQGVTDDPRALGTADHIMFWAVAKGVPEELQSQPIEAQVEWATAEVRRRKGEVVQTTEAERERARQAQNNNTVMGRGTTQPRKAAEPETFSLGGVLNEVQEERKQAAKMRRI